jgi:glycerol-3-phosphate dehydrogenase
VPLAPSTLIYDAAVIGGGVIGCAVLRALALGGARTVLLERGSDILSGASKGNSAILHTGFDAPSGSLELKCVRDGHAMYQAIREQLNLPVLETGAVVVAWNDAEAARLPAIIAHAHANGTADAQLLDRAELLSREPHLSPDAVAGVRIPGERIIDPWSAPLAYALQAIAHGAEARRHAEVRSGILDGDLWRLDTTAGPVTARIVVNCAGLHADLVEAIARSSPFTIRPLKGQFLVYDKPAVSLIGEIILPVPSEQTKGVVLTRTVFGNLLVGPTAEDQDEREGAAVTEAGMRSLMATAQRIIPALAGHAVTATYAGLRPATQFRDYQIEALPRRRWITVAGIRSTGLTAALGIAAYVAGLYADHFGILRNDIEPIPVSVPNLAEHRPRPYQSGGCGDIICHCELVTRGEIEGALGGALPAGDLGGLRRRTRAMMGRCQGFYCSARVARLSAGRQPGMPAFTAVS